MATIGIFDSGSGGLSVYREIVKLLPYERYVYYADNAHCPYGDKTADFIRDRARAITDFLLGKGADIIVVACNTATAAAIATLREEYPDVPFVGMEPAVKPAALGTETGVIGVLATAGTLKGSKYLKTKGRFEDDVHIVEHVGEGFVELVENGTLDGPEAYATVKASLQPLLDAGADRIVLGCTHYPFLRPVVGRSSRPSPAPGSRSSTRPPPSPARPSACWRRTASRSTKAPSASSSTPPANRIPCGGSSRGSKPTARHEKAGPERPASFVLPETYR